MPEATTLAPSQTTNSMSDPGKHTQITKWKYSEIHPGTHKGKTSSK